MVNEPVRDRCFLGVEAMDLDLTPQKIPITLVALLTAVNTEKGAASFEFLVQPRFVLLNILIGSSGF